jgi:hypothetical protein
MTARALAGIRGILDASTDLRRLKEKLELNPADVAGPGAEARATCA